MTKKPSCKGPLTNLMCKVLASTFKLVESGTNPSGRLVLNSVKENGRKAFLYSLRQRGLIQWDREAGPKGDWCLTPAGRDVGKLISEAKAIALISAAGVIPPGASVTASGTTYFIDSTGHLASV